MMPPPTTPTTLIIFSPVYRCTRLTRIRFCTRRAPTSYATERNPVLRA